MAPFNAVGKAPGVYIAEVQVPGPIAGVGTSTAAFVGPAQRGSLIKPTFLTNPTQFQKIFGDYIEDPQRVYVTHAVHGFFDNGGTACYFVRVGTGVQASLPLIDSATTPRPTIVVTALKEGADGNNITVKVDEAHFDPPIKAIRPAVPLTNASGSQAVVTSAADAGKFSPGDTVFLEQGGNNDLATVASISGTTINLTTNLTRTYTAGGQIRLALGPGQRRIRVDSMTGIEPGTYIKISQNGTSESGVVRAADTLNNIITLTSGLVKLYSKAADITIETQEFKLTIIGPTTGTETFDKLSMDSRHSRYFRKIVNSAVVDVALADPPTPTPPPKNLPATIAATPLSGGVDENVAAIQPSNYHWGIDALQKIDDVNILCAPDSVAFTKTVAGNKVPDSAAIQDVQAYMIAHCEKMQDRFAILDPQPGAEASNGIVTQRNNLSSENGYAAMYYPWIYISNPLGDGRILIPPSGHLAGLFAQNDNTRGVHKAPANETLTGALALEQTLADDEQGRLNDKGINVIRFFPGQGIKVWGARTIAPEDNTQWRYVNVRRLLLFIEESIQEGTRFAVFEPNDLSLWGKLKRQVTDFLTRVWRDGALFGATAEEAFRVRIDAELNPPDLRALGQLVIEVIVVPTTPAEFVVFRIISDTTGRSLIKE